jgi:hypothetical protein
MPLCPGFWISVKAIDCPPTMAKHLNNSLPTHNMLVQGWTARMSAVLLLCAGRMLRPAVVSCMTP